MITRCAVVDFAAGNRGQAGHGRVDLKGRFLLRDGDDYIAMTAARTLVKIGRADGLAAVRTFVARCRDAELVTELTAALAKATRRR